LEDRRQVTTEEMINFKNDNNLDYCAEVSAKKGTNIQEVFITAIKILYKDYLKYKTNMNSSNIYNSCDTKNTLNSFKLRSQKRSELKESEDLINMTNSSCSC
jgi:hypothetical protein